VNNSGLDISILEAYLKGTLDPKSMHRVEKEALEDPFVAEALEGLSQSSAYAQNISLLQRQLQERVAQQQVQKKTSVVTWQRLSIAAAAAVVFISVGIMFMMRSTQQPVGSVAKNKEVEVQLTPFDAADSTPALAANKLPEAAKQAESPALDIAPPARSAKVIPAPSSNVADQIPAASVAAKPAMSKNAETEINSAMTEATSTALAKNSVKAKKMEEIVIQNNSDAQKRSLVASAPAVTALESRVAGITVPTVQGKVVSQINGMPLPGAYVKVPGTNLETITNSNGEFAFYSDSALEVGKVVTGYLGFQQKEVKLKPNQALAIALKESDQNLSEVVVTARGYSKFDRSKAVPVPSVGSAEYTSYLQKNNKLFKGADAGQYVELSFSVSKAGIPEKIKVLKGLEKKYNDEAIRLLADGPKWIVPEKGSNKASLKVYF
jgi:hypothetical protein